MIKQQLPIAIQNINRNKGSFLIIVLKQAMPAIVIIFLLGWYTMNKCFGGFVYRVNIGPVLTVLAISVLLPVIMLIVRFKALIAAVVNRVKSFRTA